MFRVLLVDDEPLILAGIKTLVDWRAAGCELVGNARNGKQALTAMESLSPDIVIADINMPVMEGIELLKRAEETYPEVVFIMLTNLEEFELARESLRHHATDYLVKTQLDEANLLDSLERAKAESAKRQKTRSMMSEQGLRQIGETQLLTNSLKLVLMSPDIPAETVRAFQKAGVLHSYVLLATQFLYPRHMSAWESSPREFAELFRWEREVVEELVKNSFAKAVTAVLDYQNQQILILVWEVDPSTFGEQLESFYKRLVSASVDLTGIEPCLLATDALFGRESLQTCRAQLFELRDRFYLTGERFLLYSGINKINFQPLGLSGIAGSLKKELNNKNAAGCAALFERAITRVKNEPHEKSQALWLCTELYSTVCGALAALPDAPESGGIFFDSGLGYEQIKRLSTKDEVVDFLTAIGNELRSIQQSGAAGHAEMIGRVKQYVYENIDKRITLHEAANRVCLSAGYLSAIYKKHSGETFMDFVNRCKIEKACDLLKNEDYLIGQVSNMLSFENAYYFAKVFKRYMGVTPSEFRGRESASGGYENASKHPVHTDQE